MDIIIVAGFLSGIGALVIYFNKSKKLYNQTYQAKVEELAIEGELGRDDELYLAKHPVAHRLFGKDYEQSTSLREAKLHRSRMEEVAQNPVLITGTEDIAELYPTLFKAFAMGTGYVTWVPFSGFDGGEFYTSEFPLYCFYSTSHDHSSGFCVGFSTKSFKFYEIKNRKYWSVLAKSKKVCSHLITLFQEVRRSEYKTPTVTFLMEHLVKAGFTLYWSQELQDYVVAISHYEGREPSINDGVYVLGNKYFGVVYTPLNRVKEWKKS